MCPSVNCWNIAPIATYQCCYQIDTVSAMLYNVTARDLMLEARRRAGITQRELAERLGTHQPVVARWETGRTNPDFITVENVLEVCGFHLSVALTPRDEHDETLIARELRREPHERLAQMVQAVNAFDRMADVAHA